MKDLVVDHVNRRNKPTTADNLVSRLKGYTRSQVVAALRTATHEGRIRLLTPGSYASGEPACAVYVPLEIVAAPAPTATPTVRHRPAAARAWRATPQFNMAAQLGVPSMYAQLMPGAAR